MKVLIVRIGEKISGGEVYNLNLLKAFRKYKDIEITFITNLKELSEILLRQLAGQDDKWEIVYNSAKWTKEIGTKKDFLRVLLYSPFYIYNYLKIIHQLEKGGKFDLIILQSMTEKIFLTPVLRLLRSTRNDGLDVKIIWIEHGPLFITQRAWIIKKLYVFISRFVNKIIAVSKDTKEDLINGGVDENKIQTLYIGVDTKELTPLKSKVVKKDIVVGFLGTVCKEKGIEDFFKISKILYSKNNNFKFLIIGDGTILSRLKENVKKAGLSKNYIFTGFISDVKTYLGLMDILFFPTRHHEGLSMAVLEALSMGIPVVATDIGGNREIIKNDYNGFIYGQSEKLEKVVQLIMKAIIDKKNLGNNARKTAIKNFDIEKNAEEFYSLFQGYTFPKE